MEGQAVGRAGRWLTRCSWIPTWLVGEWSTQG